MEGVVNEGRRGAQRSLLTGGAQDLDNVYPPTNFSPALKANIAFSSLPEGDDPVGRPHSYSWRIPVPPDAVERDPAIRRPDKLPDADGFLYGFVYFVQEKVGFWSACKGRGS